MYKYILAAIIIFLAIEVYKKHKGPVDFTSVTEGGVVKLVGSTKDPQKTGIDNGLYTCDGREHCSQMTSRAEANFFNKNCPNTKMDGDRDGIPCENNFRF